MDETFKRANLHKVGVKKLIDDGTSVVKAQQPKLIASIPPFLTI